MAKAARWGRFSGGDVLPEGFDTARDNPSGPKKQAREAACPILARHFFGVEPFRPTGEVAAFDGFDRTEVLRLAASAESPIRWLPRECSSLGG